MTSHGRHPTTSTNKGFTVVVSEESRAFNTSTYWMRATSLAGRWRRTDTVVQELCLACRLPRTADVQVAMAVVGESDRVSLEAAGQTDMSVV